MEDLLSLLVIVFSIISVINKSKQKNAGKAQKKAKKASFPYAPVEAVPQPVPAAQPVVQPVQMMPPRPEHKELTPLEAMIEKVEKALDEKLDQPAGKTDHTQHVSCEGHDPCHENQLAPPVRPARVAPQEIVMTEEEEPAAIDLKFTGDELVRAFVMQEILTRPCERRSQAM